MTTDPLSVFLIGGDVTASADAADVGGKAANLMRLSTLGLRVPPAIALSTALCRHYLQHRSLPAGFEAALADGLRRLESMTGCTLGGSRPLVVSVRSSPPVSMPGMLETVLNVGLTEPAVAGLVRRTGNPWLGWDARRRFVESFGTLVLGADPALFDAHAADVLRDNGAVSIQDLDALALRDLARRHASALDARGLRLPVDPAAQVAAAVETVLRSWQAPRAAAYRRMNGIDEQAGTGVLIQAMAFGNSGDRSGSGVGFTRDPAKGEPDLYVDFLFNAQGEDVVAGRHAMTDAGALPRVLPAVWAELERARGVLEHEFGDMQDFEFTVDDGVLFFLQTRAGKRTPWAALRIACDLVHAGVISQSIALARLDAYDLDAISRSVVKPEAGDVPLARATPASLGAATGAAVFDADRARELAARGPVILVRTEMSTEDVTGLAAAAGVLSTFGGRTSHAAVVARQLGKVCLAGCPSLVVDAAARECTIGGRRIREGDPITLDGESGLIYDGHVPVVNEQPASLIALVKRWRALTRAD